MPGISGGSIRRGGTLVLAAALVWAADRDTRLADAAMRGDRAAVKRLLEEKSPVNAPQGDGMTALHWAAFRDDAAMARLLVSAGADVQAATRNGAITPLLLAAKSGSAPVLEALLTEGVSADTPNASGTTPLMMAAASGSVASLKVLLDRGAKVNAKEKVYGQTPLMFAAALNRKDAVEFLIRRGGEIDTLSASNKLQKVRFDQDGNIVPINANPAAAKPEVKPAEEARKPETDASAPKPSAAKKAGDVADRPPRDVGPTFQGGLSALHFAAREGHLETVKALVESGAGVNLVSDGEKISPLVMAAMNGRFEVAQYLLDHGADPNLTALNGLTAIYAVIDVQWAPKAWYPQPITEQEKVGYLDLMKALVAKGANVNVPIQRKLWFRSFTNDHTWIDPAGATALWRAAQSSDIEAMKILVAAGADTKIKSRAGATPLMAAAGIGWAANFSVNAPYPPIEAVKYCVELGNNVNDAEARGYTPLHGAAYLGDNEMVKFLLSKGANIKARSRSGDTVADMANGPTRFGLPHPETVALLEQLGSENSHNCRSDQCVVAANASIYENRPGGAPKEGEKKDAEKPAPPVTPPANAKPPGKEKH